VPLTIATVCLGIARAALDDLIELAKGKTPSYTQTRWEIGRSSKTELPALVH